MRQQKMADFAVSSLLPVLVDEISRLRQLNSLAGLTELPVKDTVVRQELALLRSDFAQLKTLFASGAFKPSCNNEAPATELTGKEAGEDESVMTSPAFGQAEQSEPRPTARPRMNSVYISASLPLPDGCNTHFFLVGDPAPSNKNTNSSCTCPTIRAISRPPAAIKLQR